MNNASKVKLIKLESKERYQRLFNKDLGTCGMRAGHVSLRPGENIGEHTTGDLEETLIILRGRGEARIDDAKLQIEANSILYIPPQTSHDIKNTGSVVLEYVFITSKAENL